MKVDITLTHDGRPIIDAVDQIHGGCDFVNRWLDAVTATPPARGYVVVAENTDNGRVHEYGPFERRSTAVELTTRLAGLGHLGSVRIDETKSQCDCQPGLRYKR